MRQVAMRPVELKAQQFREGEVLKDRYDIGEGLVKSRHIDVCLLLIITVNAVEQCMGRFVRDDVVRKTSKHQLSAVGYTAGWEISEQQCSLFRAVICVRLAQRVRVETQAPHKRSRR